MLDNDITGVIDVGPFLHFENEVILTLHHLFSKSSPSKMTSSVRRKLWNLKKMGQTYQ